MRRPGITEHFLVLLALLPSSCSLLLDPVITAQPDGGRTGAADMGEEDAADTGGPLEDDLGGQAADLGPTGLGFGQPCEGDLDCASSPTRRARPRTTPCSPVYLDGATACAPGCSSASPG
ncbi:MAG: hypothetical protein FJ125_00215 [Deltaproteobacteria bacterium]|nr:hypothetical protein [Deltaproteobacteria bacterium]